MWHINVDNKQPREGPECAAEGVPGDHLDTIQKDQPAQRHFKGQTDPPQNGFLCLLNNLKRFLRHLVKLRDERESKRMRPTDVAKCV